jgi:hypothetical protein
MEEEKYAAYKTQLNEQITQLERKKKEEYENKMREIVRNREIQFQNYSQKLKQQIEEEYAERYNKEKQKAETIKNILVPQDQMPKYSPLRQRSKSGTRSPSNIQSPNSENLSAQDHDKRSALSNSVYLNDKVYNEEKSQVQRSAEMENYYPGSEGYQGSNQNLKSPTNSQLSGGEFSENDEDHQVIQKHEEAKYAFENYRKSIASDSNRPPFNYLDQNESSKSGHLPLKESTFGAPEDLIEEQKRDHHLPYGSLEGDLHPYQDPKHLYQIKGGKFSNFSSPITEEEAEGESSMSYISSANDDTKNYIDTSDISSSSGTETPNRSQNPFHHPNQNYPYQPHPPSNYAQ